MFRRKISTVLKNRTWSEPKKRSIEFGGGLGTIKEHRTAERTGVYEVL